MTPRTLLTTIGATALAFAIAIGVAAETTPGVITGSTRTTLETSAEVPLDVAGAAGARLNAWNDPCVIAV